jgi:hypothetical protein
VEERLEEDEVSCEVKKKRDGRVFFILQEHLSNGVEVATSVCLGCAFFRGVLRLTVYWKLSVHLEKSTAV